MPSIKSNEFVKFVNDGKRARFGELTFQGNSVFSYETEIARVDREQKLILLNDTKYSHTTSCHQKAVLVGFVALVPNGWSLVLSNPEFACC